MIPHIGWYKVYVAVVHQHDDSTYTQFVFCTEDSEEKFEKSCDGYMFFLNVKTLLPLVINVCKI